MKIYLNSKNNSHSAIAEYSDGIVKVLAGSKINTVMSYPKMPVEVVSRRKDKALVSDDGLVLKDVSFNSPTAAAQFVTGRSSNGYISWRPDNKMSLKEYLNTKLRTEDNNEDIRKHSNKK